MEAKIRKTQEEYHNPFDLPCFNSMKAYIYLTQLWLRILKIAVVGVQECFYTPHSYEGGK